MGFMINNCLILVVFPFIMASTTTSDADQIVTRRLLQALKSCPVDFEHQNYTIITEKCRGPNYSVDPCCSSFKAFACPFADELDDLTNDCASTMFRYIDLNGHYPPGLFASLCREGREGLECPPLPPPPPKSGKKSGGGRAASGGFGFGVMTIWTLVIEDRRWKEVIGAFHFPSTITNASFVLRKYYLSLLLHFEQVYYFHKAERNTSSSPATWSSDIPALPHAHDGAASNHLTENPNMENGSLVTGTIDGKFDFGYMVTVKFGGENLKGILYHSPEAQNASTSLSSSTELVHHHHHHSRRKHMAFRDPARPKRSRSGYTFFFSEQYHRLRPMYHGQERAISKKIGQLWSRLTDSEKQVYQDKGLRDKERYRAEMSEYKTSQHSPA
ncbi:high mobility group family protein [Striga asiatica]|uniref:High mobility group family protein n=1 Tax=Striga asiatica TaxID=4170 RepID=A0A5A7RIG0_STRAF|nr:high mobility group family protein [Striga asiatica]